MTASEGGSLRHLRGHLAAVRARVSVVVAARRAVDPDPDDAYRGLYVSDDHVDRLLEGAARPPVDDDPAIAAHLATVEERADAAEAAGEEIRLRALARRFALDAVDTGLMLHALAPELDAGFERLYGYLNDDVTRRCATIGLLLEMVGLDPTDIEGRQRLAAHGPLVANGLVQIAEEPDRGPLTRAVVVPEPVVAYLLGGDALPTDMAALVVEAVDIEVPQVAMMAKALAGPSPLIHLRERVGSAGVAVGSSALRRVTGREPIAVDLRRLPPGAAVAATIAGLVREARMRAAGILVQGVEELNDDAVLHALVDAAVPRVLLSADGWDPGWGTAVPLVMDATVLDLPERAAQWRAAIAEAAGPSGVAADVAEATVAFRLGPEQIRRAARAAAVAAAVETRPVCDDDLRRGARAQNALALDRLALRIEPAVSFDDLVVDDAAREGLNDLIVRARRRDVVLREWGLRGGSSRGNGVTGLFAGPSGTGKTMAAEVVANELGLDLYVIDLSTVIDKYIGETEKNLEKVFAQADRVNGVLLFDEADALFGKRSEVSDAHDRHANVEVAYLLQRMEQFDGIALLTTNLRANIDEAFTRRLDAIVEFPEPDEVQRRALWDRNLRGRGLPLAGDVDLDVLTARFRLSGGEIHNIAITAAYAAADRGGAVAMADIVRAVAREYRKLGRLIIDSEFGEFVPSFSESRSQP